MRTLFAIALLPMLAACGMSGPAHQPPEPGVAAVVDMGMHSFEPERITIRAGDTVEWRNQSMVKHTVTADGRLAKRAGDVALPRGAVAFNSGDIPAGEIYTHNFTAPGMYRYFCRYHEKDGMVGTVVVNP